MSLTQGLQLPFGIQPVNSTPVDAWSGPYEAATAQDAIDAANAAITPAIRFQSMEVRLIISGVAHKYWYRDGVADADLVEFESGSGGGGGGGDVDLSGYAQLSGATFTGNLIAPEISGSLTRLADGITPFLAAGEGISIATGSQGQVTISAPGSPGSGGTLTELVLNEIPSGVIDGENKSFFLEFSPDKPSNVMLWLNGQLLTQGLGKDYTILGREIQIGQMSVVPGDVLVTMYPKPISVKKFSLNEVATVVMVSGSAALQIEKSPSPSQSLMVFRNGQLLTFNTDYTESDRIVQLIGGTVEEDDVFLATYSYAD